MFVKVLVTVLAIAGLTGCGSRTQGASGIDISVRVASTTTITVGAQVDGDFDPSTSVESGGTVAISKAAYSSDDVKPTLATRTVAKGATASLDLEPGLYNVKVTDAKARSCGTTRIQVTSHQRTKVTVLCQR